MKHKNYLLVFIFLLTGFTQSFSQAPQALNYQAVARDAAGLALINKTVGIKINILTGSASGPVAYSERHTITTNSFGLFTLQIGKGIPLTGTFPAINWASGNYWLQVEMDPTGGTSFFLMGTSQLISVPYAFFAEKVGSVDLYLDDLLDVNTSGVTPGQTIKWNGTQWVAANDSAGGGYVAGNGILIAGDTIHNIVWNLSGTTAWRDGQVGVGTSTPDPTAIMELNSTDQGFLPPRLSTLQRDSITTPATGLTIFNTTDSVLQVFNGDCWLATFQENCRECLFNMSISDTSGVITRTTTDTTGTDIFVNQTGGTPASINFFVIHNLPAGATATLSATSVFISGSVHLTIESDVFAKAGTYPVAIQAVCGDRVKVRVFTVTIDSCFQVNIIAGATNYDLQLVNSLPGPGTPICVVAHLNPGVVIDATSTSVPAFTTGSLDALSQVGIWNEGAIIGQGGNGGSGGSFTTFGDPGLPGGSGLNLTVRTNLKNDGGSVFGGGGGGGSVAIEVLSIPFLGSISIGAGGGGGAGDGLGGTSALPLLYDAGSNGSGGVIGLGGDGGLLNVPLTIPVGPATVIVTPNADGGEGGNYGLDGTSGTIFVNVKVDVTFVGTVFNQNFPSPPPSIFPAGGTAGNAIKRNGFDLKGILDGNYQTFFFKGKVGI